MFAPRPSTRQPRSDLRRGFSFHYQFTKRNTCCIMVTMDERRKMGMESKNVYSVLAEVQSELSVPKSRKADKLGYSYRSVEDINAAAMPVCMAKGAGYYLTDDIVPMVCGDEVRWYLMATATFFVDGCSETVTSTAYARERTENRSQDPAQITGSVSSYARKYALCGLFAIGTGEDVDKSANDHAKEIEAMNKRPATETEMNRYFDVCEKFAQLKGKTVAEVMGAVNACRSMEQLGVAPDQTEYTAEQCRVATGIVKTWTLKSEDK